MQLMQFIWEERFLDIVRELRGDFNDFWFEFPINSRKSFEKSLNSSVMTIEKKVENFLVVQIFIFFHLVLLFFFSRKKIFVFQFTTRALFKSDGRRRRKSLPLHNNGRFRDEKSISMMILKLIFFFTSHCFHLHKKTW